MNSVSVLWSLFPLAVIFYLLLGRRMAADIAAVAGWLTAIAVAFWYFGTAPKVLLTVSFSGLVAALPVSLAIAASIFQITVMMETGAMARIVALVRTVSPTNRTVQLLMLNCGFAILATSLGAIAPSILPPILLSLGYSSIIAIALPSIGYEALSAYALLGIPIVAFAGFAEISVQEAGLIFAQFMPLANTAVALAMLWLAGGMTMVRKGFIPALIAGLSGGFACIGMAHLGLVTITGMIAGVSIIVSLCVYLWVCREPLRDMKLLTPADQQAMQKISFLRAVSPWLGLMLVSLIVNMPQLPFFKLFFVQLAFPIEIIPGKPESLRIFWQGYFWIVVITLCCLPLLRASSAQFGSACRKWLARGPRPAMGAGIYFAIAYVMNFSGFDDSWHLTSPENNMIQVLAHSAANVFGELYVAASVFLSLVAGVISGSQTSSIAMLTKLHLLTAAKIGVPAILVGVAGAMGGGLASACSPAKLMSAAATIDRIGDDALVLRKTLGISILLTFLVGGFAQVLAYYFY